MSRIFDRARLLTALALVGVCVAGASGARSQAVFSALPQTVQSPADNATTPDKVALGRLLFWDPILSGGKDVACATCHYPSTGYTDNRDLPIGVHGVGLGVTRRFTPGNQIPFVRRNSPTILNAAFSGMNGVGEYDPQSAPMFWDARSHGLEAQMLEPMQSLEEMRGDTYVKSAIIPEVVSRLAAIPEYRTAFTRAFGATDSVTAANLSKAVASFERTLVTANSPFDRYMRGDHSAMTPAQVEGMAQFQNSGCANCHSGPMFSDYTLHVIGVPDNVRLTAPDTGANNTYAFRTPSLRNLAYTSPYTHSGVFPTVESVLNFYDAITGGRGGGRGGPGGPPPQGRGGPGRPGGPGFGPGDPGGRGPAINSELRRDQLDPLLRQVNVRTGRAELLQFLSALNDDAFDRTIPERVPSGLTPGGSIPLNAEVSA